MQLTDEQKTKLLERLRAGAATPRPCDVCGHIEWELSDRIFELREFQRGTFVLGGSLYPVIVMTCKSCGVTRLLNAVVLGLVEAGPPAAEAASTASERK